MDAESEAVGGYLYIADWHADVNLAVVGILVDVQTMMQDQLFKQSAVYRKYRLPTTNCTGWTFRDASPSSCA